MTVLHATVTRRNPAPVPFHHADALIKAATPDRVAGPIWPLNENEIDLPTENRPATVGAGHARDEGPGHARDTVPAHARENGNPDPAAMDAPHFLGSITARQRGIPGPLSLDVMLSADGKTVEIGPFTLDHHNLRWVQRLIGLGLAITNPRRSTLDSPPFQGGVAPSGAGGVLPETGRGITGWDLAEGLAEGETRP